MILGNAGSPFCITVLCVRFSLSARINFTSAKPVNENVGPQNFGTDKIFGWTQWIPIANINHFWPCSRQGFFWGMYKFIHKQLT
jgi:hypothetical protein